MSSDSFSSSCQLTSSPTSLSSGNCCGGIGKTRSAVRSTLVQRGAEQEWQQEIWAQAAVLTSQNAVMHEMWICTIEKDGVGVRCEDQDGVRVGAGEGGCGWQ